MRPEKILVLGDSGLLGRAITTHFRSEGLAVFGISRKPFDSANHFSFDISNPGLPDFIQSHIDPDLIIHAAGIVDLNYCEKNEAMALHLHADTAAMLNELRARQIFVSTDSVFDGLRGAYTEKDTCKPLNSYSKSKVLGEQLCLSKKGNVVVRLNIYGPESSTGRSLVEWAYGNWTNDQSISGYQNVLFNPLSTSQAATSLFGLTNELLKSSNTISASSIWHLGSDVCISKYEFLDLLRAELGFRKELLQIGNLIEEEDAQLRRPFNTCLNCTKFENYIGKLPSLREGISAVASILQSSNWLSP